MRAEYLLDVGFLLERFLLVTQRLFGLGQQLQELHLWRLELELEQPDGRVELELLPALLQRAHARAQLSLVVLVKHGDQLVRRLQEVLQYARVHVIEEPLKMPDQKHLS